MGDFLRKLFGREQKEEPGGDEEQLGGESAFLGLRSLLYEPQRLDEARSGLSHGDMLEPGAPLGVVAEMGLRSGVVVVAGFANGDARIFWSTGGGIIGELFQYPNIAAAAQSFVAEAARVDTANTPLQAGLPPDLPGPGTIRFALLTFDGARVVEDAESSVQSPTHPLYNLYAAMQDLITQLRLLDESLPGDNP